jgi:hypothetical protein
MPAMIGEENDVPPAPGHLFGGSEQDAPPGPLKQKG